MCQEKGMPFSRVRNMLTRFRLFTACPNASLRTFLRAFAPQVGRGAAGRPKMLGVWRRYDPGRHRRSPNRHCDSPVWSVSGSTIRRRPAISLRQRQPVPQIVVPPAERIVSSKAPAAMRRRRVARTQGVLSATSPFNIRSKISPSFGTHRRCASVRNASPSWLILVNAV